MLLLVCVCAVFQLWTERTLPRADHRDHQCSHLISVVAHHKLEVVELLAKLGARSSSFHNYERARA